MHRYVDRWEHYVGSSPTVSTMWRHPTHRLHHVVAPHNNVSTTVKLVTVAVHDEERAEDHAASRTKPTLASAITP